MKAENLKGREENVSIVNSTSIVIGFFLKYKVSLCYDKNYCSVVAQSIFNQTSVTNRHVSPESLPRQ